MNFDKLLIPVKEAVNSFQRRLIVLAGKGIEALPFLIEEYWKLRTNKNIDVLFINSNLEESKRLEIFIELKKLEDKFEGIKIQYGVFKDSQKFLGKTFDLLILDLHEELTPNHIGILIEVVRGGGLIIFLSPPILNWKNVITKFHKRLIIFQEDYERLRHIFIDWFIRKLKEHEGIWIYDPPNIHGKPLEAPVKNGLELKFPESFFFPKKLYELCITQDQIQILSSFESFLEKKKRKAIVIIANRGRGKSSILGIAAAGLIYLLGKERQLSIKVTAPTFSNLESVLQFAKIGLESLGISVDEIKINEFKTILKCNYGKLEVLSPYKIVKSRADIVFVDEAAGIPIPLLFRIMKKFRLTAFSSTVHGYEGAGRGFSLRFLKALEKDRLTEMIKLELKTPIRYSIDDPIEKWLYDTLLLNAEPQPIKEEEKAKLNVSYEKPNLEELFTLKENELKEFVGICVLAHYRNRPNDFAMLADAPHHSARILKLNQKVVGVLHLAEEGGLFDELIEEIAKGKDIPGMVIPSCVIKHYMPFKFFGKQKGLRVVRIAIHPELERKGLGSKMLKYLSKEAEEEGYDWIGAGFGATTSLLNFWLKNDFIPIHLSPSRNVTSGEFSAIVVKPLTLRASKIILTLNQEFRIKLLNSLFSTYFFLNPELARLLFMGVKIPRIVKPDLTKSQKRRLFSYVNGVLTYEATADSVKKLVEAHFMSNEISRVKLDTSEEVALIAKCLQGKSWKVTAKLSSIEKDKIKSTIRNAVEKMVEFYVKKA